MINSLSCLHGNYGIVASMHERCSCVSISKLQAMIYAALLLVQTKQETASERKESFQSLIALLATYTNGGIALNYAMVHANEVTEMRALVHFLPL